MKLTHKLAAAALLAGIGIAAVAPNATKAAERDSQQSPADIEFTKNTTNNPPIPPTDPSDTKSLPSLPNYSVDEIGIRSITPLDFDKHDATLGASKDGYWALPYSEGGRTMENFVMFKDIRDTNDQTWKLQAELEQQFTAAIDGGNTTLAGSYITYNHMKLASNTVAPSLQPTAPVLGDGNGTQKLTENGGKVTMVQNVEADKGKGEYYLTFGDNAMGTDDEAINLFVKDDVNIANKKYSAVIKWTMNDSK